MIRTDNGTALHTFTADVLERLAARYQRRALGLSRLDVRENSLKLRLRDLRPLERVIFERVAYYARLLHVLFELLHKLIVHALLD